MVVGVSLNIARDYDEHGPAGPTCFWKTTDEIKENESDDGDF